MSLSFHIHLSGKVSSIRLMNRGCTCTNDSSYALSLIYSSLIALLCPKKQRGSDSCPWYATVLTRAFYPCINMLSSPPIPTAMGCKPYLIVYKVEHAWRTKSEHPNPRPGLLWPFYTSVFILDKRRRPQSTHSTRPRYEELRGGR